MVDVSQQLLFSWIDQKTWGKLMLQREIMFRWGPVKTGESRALCRMDLCALYICPQSSERVSVDGMGYILCLVGGRNRVSVCVCACMRACVWMISFFFLYHGSLSNCTREKEDLQPHSTVLSFSWMSFKHKFCNTHGTFSMYNLQLLPLL